MLDEKTVTPPRLEFGGRNPTTPYAAYAGIDTLHSLLRPRTDIAAERSFIVATQVMELLFGQLRFEWTQAQHALRTDDLPGAMAALRRGLGVQDVLTGSWDILSTLTPMEFSSFRAALGEASGFQSFMYLHLEFLLGNKSPGLVKLYAAVPDVLKELTETLNSPSLYDDVLAVLRRRGVLAAEAGDPAEAAASAAYVARPEVEQAWLAVYEDEDERYQDVKQLAELMLDVAERVTRWRQRHLAAVKRSMGTKPGTGGSSGLHWLRKAAEQDVFPELWTVRNEL
ncbi:MAG TPA: tryptophan 2,3-dioxygenase family protein [Actinocrinis sp.]|nr:tryptophan 2,3-dioxygenase family protein [Actinocrinis sp.]